MLNSEHDRSLGEGNVAKVQLMLDLRLTQYAVTVNLELKVTATKTRPF